jgi:hypothetical protein
MSPSTVGPESRPDFVKLRRLGEEERICLKRLWYFVFAAVAIRWHSWLRRLGDFVLNRNSVHHAQSGLERGRPTVSALGGE